ncbi:unnamed protein product [Trichobilharzia szidati]|nr:unnamed protein product [Trichobilharzia szidati]
MEFPNTPSLVIPHGFHSSGKCRYCKQNSNEQKRTWDMTAEQLTVSDYQYMIDRGWRRSGTYCYKPLNKVTCCPSYTIRCDALNFQLKRSHKRVLNNMCDFLKYGKLSNGEIVDNSEMSSTPERNDHCEEVSSEEDEEQDAGDLHVFSLQSEKLCMLMKV